MNSFSLSTLHSPLSPPLSYTHTTPLNLRIPRLKLPSSSFQANISSPPANLKALGLGLASGFDASSTIYAQGPQYGRRGADTDPMGLLLKERIIFLGNEITDFVADATISQLLMLDAQDPTKDIRLFINSPGGSLNSAIAIYDVLQLVRADVSTIGLGIVASTASIVLGGGTKGKRFAMPNTRIMIHQPLGGISGEALDVLIQAEEIMKNKNTVVDIFSGFTGRTTEQIQKDIDWDRYMSAVEAVEFGILDGVIDRERIIPVVPVSWKVKTRFSELSLEASFLRPEVPDDEIY